MFRENMNREVKKTEQKKKNENLQGFRDNHNLRVRKYEQKKKDEDLELFREIARN